MWKLYFVWRSANQLKLPRKFLALDYHRCSRPHSLSQQKKDKTTNKFAKKMTTPAHHLLDQLMNEVKKNLVDEQIEKMKTEILNLVDKKQQTFLQDMVQICDSIYRETVDASMQAAAQMIENEKREMVDLIQGMVQKAVSIVFYFFILVGAI